MKIFYFIKCWFGLKFSKLKKSNRISMRSIPSPVKFLKKPSLSALYFCLSLIIYLSLSACKIAEDLPIQPVPDGNRDRMSKVTFSGSVDSPKYWLSKVTIVKTEFDRQDLGFKGLQSPVRAGYFEFTRDKLKFNNMVTRQFLEDSGTASQGIPELINQWDIEHTEFRLAEIDGYTTNREEENDYIPWREKSHFRIDWSKADISEAGDFPRIAYIEQNFNCWKKKTSRVVDASRQVTDDYISFTLAVEYEQNPSCAEKRQWVRRDFTSAIHYKYSFKRIANPLKKNESYTPYVFDGEKDPLLNKYGFFRTVRQTIAPDGREKNIFYMNRWNPKKKHIFYFTKDYPEEYKDLAYGAICHINKLLAKHKLNNYPLDGKCEEGLSTPPLRSETCSKGVCFELRENTGEKTGGLKKFGDIRYSFFDIVKTDTPVLGYGPSDAHPATGEIVSGNVIIYTYGLDFFLKYLASDPYIRDNTEYYNEQGKLIKKNTTKYEDSSLFMRMKQTLKEEDISLWTKSSQRIGFNSKIRSSFEYLLSKLTYAHPAFAPFTTSESPFKQTLLPSTLFKNPLMFKLLPDLPDNVRHIGHEIERHYKDFILSVKDEKSSVIYPLEPMLSQIPSLLANGLSPEEAKRKIIAQVLIHELGHVLGLRHNFYGSTDAGVHREDRDGHVLLDSSSIMDYLNIKSVVRKSSHALFGTYDEAALVYAYSNGKKDLSLENDKQYLYCSDEHAHLNFLCNKWDRGGTPSEVMMSLIENYEERYFVRNLRSGRAWWNTSYYPFIIYNDLWNIKRALMMFETAFTDSLIIQELDNSSKSYEPEEQRFIVEEIQTDLKQAIKLSIAFYNSILQLSRADRDWQTLYNERDGSIERIGIFWDKLFAMYFLMGDRGFLYNPNRYMPNASYLFPMGILGFRQMIEEIMENTLTYRVDMENWFIGFGRFLYAENASNFYNIASNGDLLEKIGIHCYSPKGLKDRFGIDPYHYIAEGRDFPDRLDVDILEVENYLETINDPYFKGSNDRLGIAFFNGNYYVTDSNKNKYSFSIIKAMRRAYTGGASLRLIKQDLYDVYYLYHLKKAKAVPQTCNNGD